MPAVFDIASVAQLCKIHVVQGVPPFPDLRGPAGSRVRREDQAGIGGHGQKDRQAEQQRGGEYAHTGPMARFHPSGSRTGPVPGYRQAGAPQPSKHQDQAQRDHEPRERNGPDQLGHSRLQRDGMAAEIVGGLHSSASVRLKFSDAQHGAPAAGQIDPFLAGRQNGAGRGGGMVIQNDR